MGRLSKGLIFNLILLFTILYPFNGIQAAEVEKLDIESFPDRELFKIDRMVPGDWADRKLTVLNIGESSFTYRTEVNFISGSEKLFDQFLVQVWDANEEIFRGKLHQLERLEPRPLNATHQEDLKFIVEFPEELGNEYQGLGFEFEIKFVIEDQDVPEVTVNPGNLDDTGSSNEGIALNPQRPIDPDDLGSVPDEGEILPSTSTNIFTYIVIGISFFLVGAIILIIKRKRERINTT